MTHIFRCLIFTIGLSVLSGHCASASSPVVVDSQSRNPLGGASIFDRHGHFVGASNKRGQIKCAADSNYPLTIRYIGYAEQIVPSPKVDSVFLEETITQLPEIVVGTRDHKLLHILAYVREYSTLATYTDTITMFREKMVDFMLPVSDTQRYRGWKRPRVINSKSYYRFTNSQGIDSVSDRCRFHFSWSDWAGVPPEVEISPAIRQVEEGVDTVSGKYSATEIWKRKGDRFHLDVNVLADTTSRLWVPNFAPFFLKGDNDFEQFRISLNYENVTTDKLSPLNLTGFSYQIESRGRGRGMFMFNRYDQPFFVTTYDEVYIVDKEYVTVKEAKKWEKHAYTGSEMRIIEPYEAPELDSLTMTLIYRVNNIESDLLRSDLVPDRRYVSRYVIKQHNGLGYRMLGVLKNMLGITTYRMNRNNRRNWNEFRRNQIHENNSKFVLPH